MIVRYLVRCGGLDRDLGLVPGVALVTIQGPDGCSQSRGRTAGVHVESTDVRAIHVVPEPQAHVVRGGIRLADQAGFVTLLAGSGRLDVHVVTCKQGSYSAYDI